MNRRVDIREDIKHYQDTLSYASSKVNYSVGENVCMLPSNMNLKIKTGTVGYNNKILVSDGNFSLGKNDEVNLMVPPWSGAQGPTIKSHEINSLSQKPNFSHNEKQEPQPITHNDEKVALVLFLQVVLQYGIFFDELVITILETACATSDMVYVPIKWLLRFWEPRFPKSYTTPDVVYVPTNLPTVSKILCNF